MTMWDVESLFAYWNRHPPINELYAAVHGYKDKSENTAEAKLLKQYPIEPNQGGDWLDTLMNQNPTGRVSSDAWYNL